MAGRCRHAGNVPAKQGAERRHAGGGTIRPFFLSGIERAVRRSHRMALGGLVPAEGIERQNGRILRGISAKSCIFRIPIRNVLDFMLFII